MNQIDNVRLQAKLLRVTVLVIRGENKNKEEILDKLIEISDDLDHLAGGYIE
jgi:hypothetical protein